MQTDSTANQTEMGYTFAIILVTDAELDDEGGIRLSILSTKAEQITTARVESSAVKEVG